MCVCVHARVHTCTSTCACIHVYVFGRESVCVCVCVCVCVLFMQIKEKNISCLRQRAFNSVGLFCFVTFCYVISVNTEQTIREREREMSYSLAIQTAYLHSFPHLLKHPHICCILFNFFYFSYTKLDNFIHSVQYKVKRCRIIPVLHSLLLCKQPV